MKSDRFPVTGTAATLQDVLDRLAMVEGLSDARRRDLRNRPRWGNLTRAVGIRSLMSHNHHEDARNHRQRPSSEASH